MLDNEKILNLGSSLTQEPKCYKVAIENYSNNDIIVNTNECEDCNGLSSHKSFKVCKTQGIILCIVQGSLTDSYDFTVECLSTSGKSNVTRYRLESNTNGAQVEPHPLDNTCAGINVHYMGKCEIGAGLNKACDESCHCATLRLYLENNWHVDNLISL